MATTTQESATATRKREQHTRYLELVTQYARVDRMAERLKAIKAEAMAYVTAPELQGIWRMAFWAKDDPFAAYIIRDDQWDKRDLRRNEATYPLEWCQRVNQQAMGDTTDTKVARAIRRHLQVYMRKWENFKWPTPREAWKNKVMPVTNYTVTMSTGEARTIRGYPHGHRFLVIEQQGAKGVIDAEERAAVAFLQRVQQEAGQWLTEAQAAVLKIAGGPYGAGTVRGAVHTAFEGARSRQQRYTDTVIKMGTELPPTLTGTQVAVPGQDSSKTMFLVLGIAAAAVAVLLLTGQT